MALVTKATDVSMDVSTGQFAPQITGLLAGEDLDAAAPCYIKGSDGLVYMADGTAADEKARIAGWTARAVKSGQPVTMFGVGTRFRYAASLTPGAPYYLGTTKGRLDTAAQTGHPLPIAHAISATEIRVTAEV